jgi:putative ABC transport system permease protein
MGLAPGSTLTLYARIGDTNVTKPLALRVTGLVEPRHDGGEDLYTVASTLAALGNPQYDRIDITAVPGTSAEGLLDPVRRAVGNPALSVRTGDEVRATEAHDVANQAVALFALIGMFVAIAVVAAGLVSASTFRIVFAQRMRQLALLRAVGAGRGSLVRALTIEGALTGFAAGSAGVLLAGALGYAAAPLAGVFGIGLEPPGLSPWTAIAAVLVIGEAVALTLGAVLAPAWRAAKVAPLEALRSAAVTAGGRTIGAGRAITGVLCAAGAIGSAGLISSLLPGPDDGGGDPSGLLFGIVGSGTLAYLALMALGPVLLRPVLALVGWPLRHLGPVGRLAVGGVGGAPRRAAAVAVVVALGVTLTAGVLVGNASLQTLVDREIAISSPADLELRAPSAGTGPAQSLPADTATRLRASRDLRHVTGYRRESVTVPGHDPYDAVDPDIAVLPALRALDVTSGVLGPIGRGEVVASRRPSEDLQLTAGDTVELHGRGGTTARLRIVATLPDSAPLHATFLLNPADLTALGATAGPQGVLADAAGSGEQARTAAIAALRTVSSTAEVSVLADQRDQIEKAVAAAFAIALGLIGLTVLIAVVGVGTTTALSVVERTRESGLLRAVGLSKNGLRAMLTTEAALYGTIGAVLGILLGVPYAWISVRALGVNAPVRLPAIQLLLVMALLAGLTALAGLLPARRAARVSPVAALGSDE